MSSIHQLAKAALSRMRRVQIAALAVPRRSAWLRPRLRLPANEPYDPLANDARARARVTCLDEGARFLRPRPLLLDAPPAAHAFYAERALEQTSASYVVELEGGTAWGHPTGGVFTADGRFVPALTHDPSGEKFHVAWTRLHFPVPRRLAGRALYLLTPEAAGNYHHWLIDLLPRLGLVQRAGYALDRFDHVIVNHSARAYEFDTLARLGIAPEKLIAANAATLLRPDTLVAPSLKRTNQTLPASDLAFLRDRFLPANLTPPHRRLYLSRRDARFRRVRNEDELLPFLRAHHFEIVSLAGLDVSAQARLFAEADVIAGPAGAAFANLAFATPHAHVIEIVPPQWLSAFHWMISARLGLEHTIVLGEGPVMRAVPDVAARHHDIWVDVDRFASALEQRALSS